MFWVFFLFLILKERADELSISVTPNQPKWCHHVWWTLKSASSCGLICSFVISICSGHFCHSSTSEMSALHRLLISRQLRCPPTRPFRCLPLRTGFRLGTLSQSSDRCRAASMADLQELSTICMQDLWSSARLTFGFLVTSIIRTFIPSLIPLLWLPALRRVWMLPKFWITVFPTYVTWNWAPESSACDLLVWFGWLSADSYLVLINL